MKVYGDHESGNCYKIRLLLSHLDRSYEWVDVDVLTRETRTPQFLAKNPNGRVPVHRARRRHLPRRVERDPVLSGARHRLPAGARVDQAKTLQWMFFEQYSHEPYIATSRYWIHYLNARDQYQDKLAEKRDPGYAALGVMERHLAAHPFFVGPRMTIADIALYGYTHVAGEGDFDLQPLPRRARLARARGVGARPHRDAPTRR